MVVLLLYYLTKPHQMFSFWFIDFYTNSLDFSAYQYYTLTVWLTAVFIWFYVKEAKKPSPPDHNELEETDACEVCLSEL